MLIDRIRQILKDAGAPLSLKQIVGRLPVDTNPDAVHTLCTERKRAGELVALVEDGKVAYTFAKSAQTMSARAGQSAAGEIRIGSAAKASSLSAAQRVTVADKVLETIKQAGIPVSFAEIAHRLDGQVDKENIPTAIQRLRTSGKIIKSGKFTDAKWSVVTDCNTADVAAVPTTAESTTPKPEPTATAQSQQPEMHPLVILTQMVSAAAALTDESLARAMQLGADLPFLQQLQSASRSLHQAAIAMLAANRPET